MKARNKPLLLAGLLLAVLLAGPLPARAVSAAQGLGSFKLEQVYVNVPELDVFLYAADNTGEPLDPRKVRAAGVQLALGDTVLETGNVQMANEPICYIFALDNSARIAEEAFEAYRQAIIDLSLRKDPRDEIMIYTLAGEPECVLPATGAVGTIQNAVRAISRGTGQVNMLKAATRIYEDVNADYQNLAVRKALIGCTDSMTLLEDISLLGGVASGAVEQLNMAFFTVVASEEAEDLTGLGNLIGDNLVFCKPEDIGDTIQTRTDALADALEIKTVVDESLYGERLETLTLSVPALGSAVNTSTAVYMGHRLTQPAVEAVEIVDRSHLKLTFNQAVTPATAELARSYHIVSEDIWGFRVGVRAVELAANNRSATLTTDDLYDGAYSVSLRNVAAQRSTANVSDSSDETAFTIDGWPRDRAFYLARWRTPLVVMGALLLVLALQAFGRSRRDRAAEHAAEVEHMLSGAESNAPILPRRWLTLFIQPPGSVAENRWSAMVESSLLVGSDAAQCELCIPDERLAAQHCLFSLDGDGVLVQAVGSARVTVNGQRIAGEHRLNNDDTIRIGRTTLRVVL